MVVAEQRGFGEGEGDTVSCSSGRCWDGQPQGPLLVVLPTLESALQGLSPTLSKGLSSQEPRNTRLFLVCKDEPQAHQQGVPSREEEAHAFTLAPMWPSTWGAVWVGAANQSLAAPSPLP